MSGEEHVCPVCGSDDWDIDYDRTDDGDMRVGRCARCEWPPPYPVTVAEWRERWSAEAASQETT